jgi:phospholipid/cholesterol/gamma-HCH transport system substrate-binding protein
MRNTIETRLGILLGITAIVVAFILEMSTAQRILRNDMQVRAYFGDAHELQAGDPVKMGGLPVGRVSQIALDQNSGRVAMTILVNKNTPLYDDCKATIKVTGLLGQNFVSIDFGTVGRPRLNAGSILQTYEQTDLNAVILRVDQAASGLAGLTRNFNAENLGNLLEPFKTFMEANSPNLASILLNLDVTSSKLTLAQGTAGKLINEENIYSAALEALNSFDSAMLALKPLIAEMQSTLSGANQILIAVNAGNGSLGKITKDEALFNETLSAMSNLREIFGKINQGRGTIGILINDDSFLRNATMSLHKVNMATEELEDTRALSLGGIAAGKFIKPFSILK